MRKTPVMLKKLTKEEKKRRYRLTVLFAFAVFFIQTVSILIAGAIVYSAYLIGFSISENSFSATLLILLMATISLIIGFLIALILGKFQINPFAKIINQLNRLASGDFSARLEFSKKLVGEPVFSELSDSFNKMAEELEKTEMLRGDFVNNFSHEFKTPIVSIAGFAKLLKRPNLTDEQRREYADIIEKESMRLSYMATNVLDLTKIENQSILTGKTDYNLSEQIRYTVLLLEDKWIEKNISFSLGFPEIYVRANNELLLRVWINLIDNAIKFSPYGECVEIGISEDDEKITVSVKNRGSEISKDDRSRIFGKFYQADRSHSASGNGIGLAIVSKVVSLHGGEIFVSSENMVTSFDVILPKELD